MKSAKPRVFIRADGNSRIGLGHIMRTGALAGALQKLGAEAIYLSRDPAFVSAYECVHIPPDLPLVSEPEWFAQLLASENAAALVVDHYGFDQPLLDQVFAIPGIASLIIDDMNLYTYESTLLLNQNAYAPDLIIKGRAETMLGSEYIMIRDEFTGLHRRQARPIPENVLITMGAADPQCYTQKLLEMLPSYQDFSKYKWHVIIGPAFAHGEQIRAAAAALTEVILHANPAAVKDLMIFCDISISAAGSSIYELAACGVPSLLVVAGENQIMLAEKAELLGWSRNLGSGDALPMEKLIIETDALLNNEQQRIEMARKGQEAIDGQGAGRVAERLMRVIRRR